MRQDAGEGCKLFCCGEGGIIQKETMILTDNIIPVWKIKCFELGLDTIIESFKFFFQFSETF